MFCTVCCLNHRLYDARELSFYHIVEKHIALYLEPAQRNLVTRCVKVPKPLQVVLVKGLYLQSRLDSYVSGAGPFVWIQRRSRPTGSAPSHRLDSVNCSESAMMNTLVKR